MDTDPATQHNGAEQHQHTCWVALDDDEYVDEAIRLLAAGHDHDEKTIAFAPEGSTVLADIGEAATVRTDPRTAVLGGGPLDPERMFDMFREQADQARAEGYRGIRLVADMDWLLPLAPTAQQIATFELGLDRVVDEVGATVICAYRASSFGPELLDLFSCIHPAAIGEARPVPFHLRADRDGARAVTGEIDVADSDTLARALEAMHRAGDGILDAAGLRFIDVAGMRQLAQAGQQPIVVRNASTHLRRMWRLSRFDEAAPLVTFS